MPFDLIIWDCDGCLVDSEAVACGMAAAYLTELGYPITGQGYVDRFAGRSMHDSLLALEAETGQPFAARFDFARHRARTLAAFERELRPIPFVERALAEMALPRCIASGSSRARIRHSLALTGLAPFFEDGAIFSTAAEDVAQGAPKLPGKPAPDVFLHAAERMGFRPEKCLVIEDSDHGIAAAKAAGMSVFAFTGGSHVSAAWRARVIAAGPDASFADMRDLPGMINANGPMKGVVS